MFSKSLLPTILMHELFIKYSGICQRCGRKLSEHGNGCPTLQAQESENPLYSIGLDDNNDIQIIDERKKDP